MPYDVCYDEEGEIVNNCNVLGVLSNFLIDKEGKICSLDHLPTDEEIEKVRANPKLSTMKAIMGFISSAIRKDTEEASKSIAQPIANLLLAISTPNLERIFEIYNRAFNKVKELKSLAREEP